MNCNAPVLEQVIARALHLPPIQKVQLVEKLMEALEKELAASVKQAQPRCSLYGVLADLGPAPSAEEIDDIDYNRLFDKNG